MKKDKLDSTKSGNLRKKAEKRINKRTLNSKTLSGEGVDEIIHELEVHQIELEMQNDEIRRALIELEESRCRYSDLYDFAPIGYFILDKNGLIHDVNLMGAAMIAQERASLIKKPFHLYVAHDFKDLFYLHRRKVLDTQTKQSCEIKLVRKDGTLFWGLFESKTVADSDGNLNCWTAISDITPQKQAEQQIKLLNKKLEQRVVERTAKLSETVDKLQSVVNERKQIDKKLQLLAAAVRNSNDAITILDLEGNIISWNLGAERVYGYSEAEATKMNVRRIIPDHKQDEMKLLIKRLLKGETIEFFETQRLAKNNRILDISLTATILNDEKNKPFAITTAERDITERRCLEKEILDITEREREQIGQELHDGMGQILTGIAVLCKGLALKLKGKSSEEVEDALVISKLANQAIGHTRDLAKMLYPIDLQTGGLASALKTLASNAEKTMQITCRFRCGKSVSVNNLVGAKQIYRIVQEAMTNAVRHGKAKQIDIELHLTKKGTVLSVESDGLDFPKRSLRQKGFGLKIMQYRTDLIGGSLDIRKGGKGGTVVTCIFPNGK